MGVAAWCGRRPPGYHAKPIRPVSPPGQGNGAYMEYGISTNDTTPVELGGWLFLVGQAEPWISDSDQKSGCIIWKQGVRAARTPADKYGHYGVHPHHGSGPISIGGT